MEQQWQQQQPPPPFHPTGTAGGGLADNRVSTMTTPYDVKTHQVTHSVYDPTLPSPSPGSPPPPSQQQHSPSPNYLQTATSNNGFPPALPSQQGHQGVSPTEPGFQQYQHDMSSYHELPVARADGQLREMP